MTLDTLSRFLMWCTIINGSLLALWSCVQLAAPQFVHRLHSRWFPIEQEQHLQLMFIFLGVFKVFFVVFNLVPFIAIQLV